MRTLEANEAKGFLPYVEVHLVVRVAGDEEVSTASLPTLIFAPAGQQDQEAIETGVGTQPELAEDEARSVGVHVWRRGQRGGECPHQEGERGEGEKEERPGSLS